MPGETFAERQQQSLSDRERQAAVLLFEDGWTQAELSLALNTTDRRGLLPLCRVRAQWAH